MQKIVVDNDSDRLDSYLSDALDISRSKVSKMIKDNLVLVNGKKCKSSQKVLFNDIIEYEIVFDEMKVEAEDILLDIVYDRYNALLLQLGFLGESDLVAVSPYPDLLPDLGQVLLDLVRDRSPHMVELVDLKIHEESISDGDREVLASACQICLRESKKSGLKIHYHILGPDRIIEFHSEK